MQLVSLPALSAFVAVAASVGIVNAIPAVHNNPEIAQRASVHHRALAARDIVAAKPRSPAGGVPRTLQAKNKKRTTKQKRCRVRPTTSAAPASATSTSTSSASITGTGTIDGGVDNFHGHHSSSTSSSASAAPTSGQNWNSQWTLSNSHQGDSFFDNWTFWDSADPTHGTVQFLDRDSGKNAGLWSVDGGVAYMRASTADNTWDTGRPSIRIQDTYTWGVNTLVLMDAAHMPTGCGTWPAWWSNGPNWPYGGEIDILEGVNDESQNHATLHTGPTCSVSGYSALSSTGQFSGSACDSTSGSNNGCGFTDTQSDNSYGTAFNGAGGGVYAMRLTDDGIAVWFFTRSSIPQDIVDGQPVPENWPAPFASFASTTCNMASNFYQQISIFDTTFCGDWAGSDWSGSGCADKTGKATCADYVNSIGSNFAEAYWAVNYVKYFTTGN